jgi:hypothetical protein
MKKEELEFDNIIIKLKEARYNKDFINYDKLLKLAINLVNTDNIPGWKTWLLFNQEHGNLRYTMSPFAIEIKNKIKIWYEEGKKELHTDLLSYPYGIMLKTGYYYLNNGFN